MAVELRERRSRLGLTQQELADELGVTANTVARWERGAVGVPPPVWLALRWLQHAQEHEEESER